MSVLMQTSGPGCPSVDTPDGFSFTDAFKLIFEERESVNGGVCIGGLKNFADLGVDHLKVSVIAMAIAIVITLPVGLYLGHIRKGEFLAVTVSNIGRAIPSPALLAFFIAFLGLGLVNSSAVLALLAIPPILTNTYVGVRQVDAETVSAARGVGLTELQIIRQVELPLALSTIFAGIRTSAVAVVATATIVPLANTPSLGTPIIESQTYGESGQLAGAIVVALITLAVDAGLGLAQRMSIPKGLTVTQHVGRKRRFSLPTTARTES